MIGFKTLAVPGPTNMPFEVRRAMDVALEDHRAPDLPEFTLPLLADLKKVFKTETGNVFVFPGSGTGGWESAISNTLCAGDKVLTASFGQFSSLWVQMCRTYGLDVVNCDVTWGEGTPLEDYKAILETDKNQLIRAVLVCHNETATGVTSEVAGVRKILDDLGHPALLFVDGVSSVGSLDFRMDEWGVDVIVSGSQKGFMLPTGLAIVGVSQKAMEAGGRSTIPADYFSYASMKKMNEQGYFPYTPAMTLLRGLRASMDMMFDEGLENVFARHHRLASGVRAAVTAWGLQNCSVDTKWYSDTVTAIRVPEDIDANNVIKTAYHTYGVSLGAGLGPLNGNVFRIGHLGWLNETMVLQALGGVEMAMRDVGVKFIPGCGVGAAIEKYTDTKAPMVLAAE